MSSASDSSTDSGKATGIAFPVLSCDLFLASDMVGRRTASCGPQPGLGQGKPVMQLGLAVHALTVHAFLLGVFLACDGPMRTHHCELEHLYRH